MFTKTELKLIRQLVLELLYETREKNGKYPKTDEICMQIIRKIKEKNGKL